MFPKSCYNRRSQKQDLINATPFSGFFFFISPVQRKREDTGDNVNQGLQDSWSADDQFSHSLNFGGLHKQIYILFYFPDFGINLTEICSNRRT